MKTDGIFFTYRCQGCRSIVTKLQVLAMQKTGDLCPCGSGQIKPCNLVGLDWLLPRVWRLVYAVWRGQLAPEPEPSNVPPGVSLKQAGGAGA
jgi:hypothetical protein